MFPSTPLNVNITKLFCGLHNVVANGGHIGDFNAVTKKKGKTLSFN